LKRFPRQNELQTQPASDAHACDVAQANKGGIAMLRTLTASPLLESVRLANELIDLLRRPAGRDGQTVKQPLQDLARLVDCLPLNQDEYCYFINRVASTTELIAAGEIGAAIYQLRELHHKLERVLADRG
jgi:hypothetical protein